MFSSVTPINFDVFTENILIMLEDIIRFSPNIIFVAVI